MDLKIKKLTENAIIPSKKTDGSAAYDLSIPKDVLIPPGRSKIDLNIAMEIPFGYEAKIESRSSCSLNGVLALDADLFPSNYILTEEQLNKLTTLYMYYNIDVLTGKIDSDYRGEISLIVKNNTNRTIIIPRKSRIAQLTFYKVESFNFVETDTLSETKRANNGFGHTGIN